MAPPNPHRPFILHLFKAGVAPVDISERLGVPSRTVYDTISRFKKLSTFLDRCGKGRKATVVTPDRIKAVKERTKRNPLRSIKKMAKDMKISRSSMERIVKDKTSDEAVGYGRTIHQVSHPASGMVFGAVSADSKTPLLFVDQGVKINKEVSISDILEETLLPWTQKHINRRQWAFQQDGAPSHTAKLSQQ
ncbi:unnamed protein product [Caenorhabditis auriculariae]|uniref:Paired domain-containing protein n=1 Tax=Caenorhabditis auriculariae TaxID=2777116 RepID=A0A8S1H611_9PELO|nr:unnamed protein product [Caenorhabditis auriculariae]